MSVYEVVILSLFLLSHHPRVCLRWRALTGDEEKTFFKNKLNRIELLYDYLLYYSFKKMLTWPYKTLTFETFQNSSQMYPQGYLHMLRKSLNFGTLI